MVHVPTSLKIGNNNNMWDLREEVDARSLVQSEMGHILFLKDCIDDM
jgi:hypothetical protein